MTMQFFDGEALMSVSDSSKCHRLLEEVFCGDPRAGSSQIGETKEVHNSEGVGLEIGVELPAIRASIFFRLFSPGLQDVVK